MQDIIVRIRLFTIINSDKLKETLKNLRINIGIRISDMAFYQSGLIIIKI